MTDLYENNDRVEVAITVELDGSRLDKALAVSIPDLSRARIQDVIAAGGVTCNGKVISKTKHAVTEGEVYILEMPDLLEADPEPQDIPINIIHEDNDLLVINKPVGMVVHPAAGNRDGTLVNALLYHCGDTLSGIGGVKRPGIVHRLDKDTSGLMVVAKHDQAHNKLGAQLKDHSLSRVYHAFVWGVPSPRQGTIETQIARDPRDRMRQAVVMGGGKHAVTAYKVHEQFGTLASTVECRLQTGRTHQIRVHMQHIKHYMVGDKTYGHPHLGKHLRGRIGLKPELADVYRAFARQALHAVELGFVHPGTGETVSFTAPYPSDMAELRGAFKQLNIAPSR